METIQKNNKINIIKKNFKKEKIFFLFNSLNQKSLEKTIIEQNIKKLNFNSKKINNKFAKVVLNKSVYKKLKYLFIGITCLVKHNFNLNLSKKILIDKFKLLNFGLIICKLNNKVYSSYILKKVFFLKYISNALLFFQYLVINLKMRKFLKNTKL